MLGAAAAAIAVAFAALPPWGKAALAAALALSWAAWAVLPRLAHGAFVGGRLRRARLYYRTLGLVRWSRRARAEIAVSLAACFLSAGQPERALAALERIDPERLGEAARSVWLNNRAYARAQQKRELHQALADVNAAITLRPDVAGFRHTRGLVLLGLGRVDDAIRDLDAVWSQSDERDREGLLEAERCFHLGTAWEDKGERAYAADYFRRAHRAAPECDWARQARAQLESLPGPEDVLSGL